RECRVGICNGGSRAASCKFRGDYCESWDQAPEIFVFFKHIDSSSMADPGPQLQKVLDFRKSLEESRQVLSHGFANETEFNAEADRHLRAFAKGELPPANAPCDKVLLPLAVIACVSIVRNCRRSPLTTALVVNSARIRLA
ncbi:MAG: hypothetical protein ACKV2Q_13820, partial [Planctomycetaceae bacterium]